MRTRALIVVSILTGAVLTACAHRGGTPPGMAEPADVRPLSQSVRLEFASNIPDDYWVLSGPVDTYQKLEVNRRLRAALERYAAEKSGGTSGEALVLSVRLDRFWTGFRAVGALADTNIPEEIRKSATLGLSADLVHGNRSLGERQVEKDATDVERADGGDFEYPNYDYEAVLNRVIRLALEDLDAFVDGTVGSRG